MFYAWGALPIPKTGLERLTDATIADPDELRRDGARARKRGWAVTRDELEVGLTGVAVPVQGARGDVVAALGISGPTQRLEARLDELGREPRGPRRAALQAAARPYPQQPHQQHQRDITKEGVA